VAVKNIVVNALVDGEWLAAGPAAEHNQRLGLP